MNQSQATTEFANTMQHIANRDGITTTISTKDRSVTIAPQQQQSDGISDESARQLVTGGDPDERYPVPFFTSDFAPAPDIEAIAMALIEECDEFDDLRWAIEEEDLHLTFVWKKKGAKSDDTVRTGALAKTGGMVKHFSGAQYVVGLSRDANLGRTRFQVEAEVWHQLNHIKVAKKLVGKGDDKVEVPVFKKRHHDLEMFHGEVKRYGFWRSELQRAVPVFEQARLPIESEKRSLRLLNGAEDA